jgi:ATP-dependent protease ClpP protease subunit
MVVEQTARGERAYDIYSRLLKERVIFIVLVLRQEPARGAQAHRRADRVHLRRMRRTVHGHHPRGATRPRW